MSLERHVKWIRPSYELLPFAYSVSIASSKPIAKPGNLVIPETALLVPGEVIFQSYERFIGTMARFPGFKPVKDEQSEVPTYFINERENMDAMWFIYGLDYPERMPTITTHIGQKKPDLGLDNVVNRIAPQAVEIFNALFPERQISQATLEEVTRRAYQNNQTLPQCKFKR